MQTERLNEMKIDQMTDAELNMYIGLLPLAYKFQKEKIGMVCGIETEKMRDQMFNAIRKVINA